MSEQHSTPTEQKAFQDAIAAAQGLKTEADKAASNASLDEAYTRVQKLKFEAAQDPTHAYHGAPDSFWQNMEAPVMAARIRAGLAPTPTPKTTQQLAQEQIAQDHRLPTELNPNLVELINVQGKYFHENPEARDAAEKALKLELGPVAYSKLLVEAELFFGKERMTPEVKASKQALQAAAAQYRYNSSKRAAT